MQQLVGRLTAFDPEASESLRVISYFDALIAGGVGVDGLLRGAALLSGTVAGAELMGKTSRRDPEGRRVDAGSDSAMSIERAGSGWRAWLEREGQQHASDQMIVERLALALELLAARRNPESGLDVAIDEARTLDDRAAALARLRVEPATRARLIASSVEEAAPSGPSTVVPTKYGMLRATLDLSGKAPRPARAGLGTWGRADNSPASWAAAIIAWRLADAAMPVVDAAELGSLLLLARDYDPAAPPDDVLALDRLDARSAKILRVLVEADSERAAAVELGMHHSSLQARHESLTRELGYDARTVGGRIRYGTAEMLRRLTDGDALRRRSG